MSRDLDVVTLTGTEYDDLQDAAERLAVERAEFRRDAERLRSQLDDSAVLIARLAHSLRKSNPANGLPAKALDYLDSIGKRGNPLRDDDLARPAAPVAQVAPCLKRKGDLTVVGDGVVRASYELAEPVAQVAQAEDYKALYLDLVMQVMNKVPGVSRHDRAKQIIIANENQCNGPEAAAQGATTDGGA